MKKMWNDWEITDKETSKNKKAKKQKQPKQPKNNYIFLHPPTEPVIGETNISIVIAQDKAIKALKASFILLDSYRPKNT